MRFRTAAIASTLILLSSAVLAAPAAAPGTQDGADVYHGELELRSTVNGYVISIEGDWGGRNFFFRSLDPVEPLAVADRQGKVVYLPRELLVSLPASATLVRLIVPDDDPAGSSGSESFQVLAGAQRRELLARYGADKLIEELEGFELAVTGVTRPALGVGQLLVYSREDLAAVLEAARGLPEGSALESLPQPYFNQTPPDDPSGGGNACTSGGHGSSSCSKTCGTSGDSCSVSCRSIFAYACCYCSSSIAYCTCRSVAN